MSVAAAPARARTRTTDVAVVGAGIVGCMVAREVLARRPGTSVTVLDRAAAGDGASRRSAGLHFPRGRSAVVREWSRISEEHYDGWRAGRPDLPVRALPMAVLSRATGHDELQETYLGRLRPGAGVPAPLRTLPEGTSVWWLQGARHADVGALTRLLAAQLRDAARVEEGVEVTAVRPAGSHVELALGTGGSLRAGQVVLATGPWLHDPAFSGLLAPLRARVKKIVALHVDIPALDTDAAVVLHEQDAFLLPLPERGHWLFSYTRDEWDVDPQTLTGALTGADLAEGLRVLHDWAPELAACTRSGRVFCDAYSADGVPEIRRVAPRVTFAGGANGSGYRLAPAMAARAADLLTDADARGGLSA